MIAVPLFYKLCQKYFGTYADGVLFPVLIPSTRFGAKEEIELYKLLHMPKKSPSFGHPLIIFGNSKLPLSASLQFSWAMSLTYVFRFPLEIKRAIFNDASK